MRLLIISHTEHYHCNGQICGWGPTVREIDQLSSMFSEICHIACLHPGPAPQSMLPYRSGKIRMVLVPPAGGDGLKNKFRIPGLFPSYARTILRELPRADVVHVRAPANISLLAMVLLAFVRRTRLRWIKYAGNWKPAGRESWSYRFQRWWLQRGFARALVTVNGEWPGQPDHIRSFLNPCLTERERVEAASTAMNKQFGSPLHMIFVGRVERAKGIGVALQVLARLRMNGLPACLDVVGDGPERPAFERMAVSLGIAELARFHGWVPRTDMGTLYSRAHFILLPSTASEGWPKVLSEAMAYGVVPLAGDVSSIGQYLHRFSVGRALLLGDVDGFVQAVKSYTQNPALWKQESMRGIAAASNFTYDSYLCAVRNLLDLPGDFTQNDPSKITPDLP